MNPSEVIVDVYRRSPVNRMYRRLRQLNAWRRWVRNGRPFPTPHLVKQTLIRKYAQQFGLNVLVETGTYKGDMLLAMLKTFRRMYSIELQPELYRRAVRLFRGRPHIRLLEGDSGARIAEVLQELDEPALFWLDGHYSAGGTAKGDLNTPIVAELNQILSHRIQDHVILIDDAREFTGQNDYPSVEQLRSQLSASGQFDMTVQNDVIAVTRRAA